MKVWRNLTQEQASLYAATVTDMLSCVDGASDDITRRGLVLATMARLKQVCNHPAHLFGDGSRNCGAPLFPEPSRDLTMSCNCPDWSVPCKHLASAPDIEVRGMPLVDVLAPVYARLADSDDAEG